MSIKNEDIENMSEEVRTYLQKENVDKKQIIKITLSLEAILTQYQNSESTFSGATLNFRKHFGKKQIELIVNGNAMDPFALSVEDEVLHRLMSRFDNAPVWTFKNGKNYITFPIEKEKKSISTIAQLVIAIILAVVLGYGISAFAENFGRELSTNYLMPLFDVIMSALRAVASFGVFTSVVSGICGIGNVLALRKIGKTMFGRFFLSLFTSAIVSVVLLLPFFTMDFMDASGKFNLVDLYKMILDIIPADILSPFITGNLLQVIFLAFCLGITLLILENKTQLVVEAVTQLSSVFDFIIGIISKLLPITVFISIFDMILTGKLNEIIASYKIPLLLTYLCMITVAAFLIKNAIHLKVSAIKLLKKMWPFLLLAFSTASSMASLPVVKSCCEDEMGVSTDITAMGLPLGQVLYKIGSQCCMLVVGLFMAEYYNIPITAGYLVQLFISSILLTLATPPIAGGAVAIYTILFSQLNIPVAAISMILILDPIVDRIRTATNLATLSLQTLGIAEKMDMLNKDKLR